MIEASLPHSQEIFLWKMRYEGIFTVCALVIKVSAFTINVYNSAALLLIGT